MQGRNGRQRVDAVIPVGRDASLLGGCLEALQGQPIDRIIVVDDSPQGELRLDSPATVLRSGGRGPYAARNVGWRASEADVVLFLDVRSRPCPGWARRLAETFEDPDVALASTDILVLGGPTLGAQVGERHRMFRWERYTRDEVFRPYAPTCNLAVRRTALVACDGFREIRSTADVDLCWRILGDPSQRLERLPHVLMEWVPRARLREYFEQCFRYGSAHRALYTAWADEGAPGRNALPYYVVLRRSLRVAVNLARAGLLRRDRDEMLDRLCQAGRLAYELGYRRAAGAEAAVDGFRRARGARS